jgi:hypothetical protein
MLVREFLGLGELQGFFSFFNFMTGKLLHSASPFYYGDFVPRFAGRVCGAGQIRWAGDDFFPRFAGMLVCCGFVGSG